VGGWFDALDDKALPADPHELGIDNYFEFPPHGFNAEEITETIPERASDFVGHIHSYDLAVKSGLAKLW
jgi:hypothetical protein